VLKFLSVKSIVIAPARTGNDKSRSTAVINIVQTNKGSLLIVRPIARMLTIVVIKLIAPKIEEAPAKCKLNIAKSTDGPEWEMQPLNGG